MTIRVRIQWIEALKMPIATRRQAQARSRDQQIDTSTIGVPAGELPSQVANEDDAAIDQEMEDDDQGGEEDEEVVGKISPPSYWF